VHEVVPQAIAGAEEHHVVVANIACRPSTDLTGASAIMGRLQFCFDPEYGVDIRRFGAKHHAMGSSACFVLDEHRHKWCLSGACRSECNGTHTRMTIEAINAPIAER
jgi:hypothetical protein